MSSLFLSCCDWRAGRRSDELTQNTPPLRARSAKLLLAFQGWLIGYDGHYEFDNIGESYISNKVPYVGMRTLPALLGSAIPTAIYAIMRESGYPRLVGLFSAFLVLFGASTILSRSC